MPSPYRRDVARLKAEVVARVAAGESLRAIGAVAGMPCQATVRKWALADAGFAGDLAAARARAGALELRYDAAVAAAFLARAKGGETVNALLRAPGMPSASGSCRPGSVAGARAAGAAWTGRTTGTGLS